MVNSADNYLGIHLARMLAEKSGLKSRDRLSFATLIQSLTEAVGDGHSCLFLSDSEKKLVEKTDLVSAGDGTPLVIYNNHLYLHRYYSYESRLAGQIKMLAAKRTDIPDSAAIVDKQFGHDQDGEDMQKVAAKMAADNPFTIISGGPGTGKTSTVVRILAVIFSLFGADCKVVLAAPTGKAAMRLRQSLADSLAGQKFTTEIRSAIPEEAMTLHRLLGVKKHSVRFIHNQKNPLPWQVVVVDEASMVDLALMSKLVDALPPEGRLILLGDKDQLASVESGAVLSDLVQCLPENTVILRKSYRFNCAIKALSEAVNKNLPQKGWQLLSDKSRDNLNLLGGEELGVIRRGYDHYMELAMELPFSQYSTVFAEFNRFQVLCAVRLGKMGVDGLNSQIEQYFTNKYHINSEWYPGKPIMIRRNDYTLNLYNGDIGICLEDPDDGSLKIWFEDNDGGLRSYLPYRLPEFQVAYAMTIHKSQGSEFDEVVIALPDDMNPVITRELLYTGITRARKRLWIHVKKEIFEQALGKKTIRYSNLSHMISCRVSDQETA